MDIRAGCLRRVKEALRFENADADTREAETEYPIITEINSHWVDYVMKNGMHLRKLLDKGAKFARMAVCIGVAGSMLIGGNTLIASASTLADVFDAMQYAVDYADLKS